MVPAKIDSFNSMQTSFIKWAINKKSMLLQATPGKGKSIASMGLFLLLRQQNGSGKMLVITRKKDAGAFKKANIKNLLLLTVFSNQDTAIFYPGYDFPADIYVMSIPCFTSIVSGKDDNQKRGLTELLRKTTLLCIDEIHGYRDYKSARTKAMKKATDYFHKLINHDPKAHRLVGITATPVYKQLENLHPIFSLLCSPNPLGSWKTFMANYCELEEQQAYGRKRVYSGSGSHSFRSIISFNRIVGYKNVDHLHRVVEPFIFTWDETEFKFNFSLHYYSLTQEEYSTYKNNLWGIGLGRAYAIDLEINGTYQRVYRNSADTFYLPNKKEVRVNDLSTGDTLLYNGSLATVKGLYEKGIQSDNFSTRAFQAQQCNSRAVDKLRVLSDLVRSREEGALVYFNFLESVEAARNHLTSEFPDRRVVVLTGKTERFDQVVFSIGKTDIVLMSSVASQSLDMYIPRLIIAECFGLTPGKIEQLVGRMTRENAEYREVGIAVLLREGNNVEAYFYEKLRLRLRSSKVNVFVTKDSLPVSDAMVGIPEQLVDEAYLKKKLLWSLS
jgi:hypothetical protein